MKMNKKKLRVYAKNSKKTQLMKVTVDLEKALGAAQRAFYLEENPTGYKKINHVHKGKKEYSRKTKHKKPYY
ncbi:MAG: Unknown protein [uncultured Aureispira sp.]|uniref:Uncharacterized protein n=1 Tax=uncultured Aureispira sp. TaxID=1331704 RepID=A0A6S6RV15_9BACT|nr:MAG: Unknown protein [uncultured Aureispira sp.]